MISDVSNLVPFRREQTCTLVKLLLHVELPGFPSISIMGAVKQWSVGVSLVCSLFRGRNGVGSAGGRRALSPRTGVRDTGMRRTRRSRLHSSVDPQLLSARSPLQVLRGSLAISSASLSTLRSPWPGLRHHLAICRAELRSLAKGSRSSWRSIVVSLGLLLRAVVWSSSHHYASSPLR